MIKICHITSTPQGSIPRILRECSSAVEEGMKPYVVVQGKSYEKDGISFIGVKQAKNKIYRMLITSVNLYREAKKVKADIYQIHDPELLPFALKLKKKGYKVIFDSHEFYGIQIETKDYIPRSLRKFIAKVYKVYEAYVCKRIDAVIAVCTINNRNYFENRASKTIYIANLPDTNVFCNQLETTKRDTKTVVYVGALSKSRGITNLIQAINKTDANLVLCGPFSSKEYYEEVKPYLNTPKVTYKGILSRKEVVELLKRSYIGVSTLLNVGQYSLIDTLPTKVYEYMAMGIPVIVSDTPFSRKVISKYEFGICVNPEDIKEIANKISFLLKNPDIAKKMGENGRRAVEQRYNWDVEKKKLIDLYKSIM